MLSWPLPRVCLFTLVHRYILTPGRASQFTTAKQTKTKKPTHKGHSNRNADTAGWESTNAHADSRSSRGGRGAARGARGGRGGEPFRGGRGGGRGGARGGRPAGAPVASASTKANGFPTSTATTAEGWADQVEQSNAAEASLTSNADDFSAAGGLSDAPAAKELEAAAKQGNTDWQEDIKKPVPPPKKTWAQIAK